MKKLLLLITAVAMMLPSCKSINEELDSLDNRLDKLENEAIPSIDEQIANINTSIADLEVADVELKNYITALQSTAADLQKSIDATNTKIDNVKTALQDEISTAKAEVLAQLNALRTEMNNELSQINSTIATLQAKDTELEGKITELRTYVDAELKNTKDWATATFSTLEQYNALCTEIATIKTQIENLNKSISDLETRLNTKIATDIAAAVKGLQGELADAVTDITNSYTSAISTAKNEITAAYTVAIQNAISALETSMKQWIGEQLANYYTIAESEAKLAALKADLEAQLAVQKTYCESLMTALTNNMTEQVGNLQKQIDAINKTIAELNKEIETLYTKMEQSKAEITTAYTEAIAKAIEENEGKWSNALAKEIEALNELIEKNNIAAFDAFAEEATSRLEALEADVAIIKNHILELQENVAALLSRIQSVTYIPKYSDGKADIDYDTKTVELDYQISPKSAISDLSKVWESALKVKTTYAATRAVTYENTPIVSYSADVENATITVTVSLANLDSEFFNGIKEASMALQITDGNNFINSDYTVVYDRNIYEIRYTTSDGSIVTPNLKGMVLVSNTYQNGLGVIRYASPIRKIDYCAFYHTDIENNDKLVSIELPRTVSEIYGQAFYGCSSLVSITLSESLTYMENSIFSGSLKAVYCKAATPPSIYFDKPCDDNQHKYTSWGSFPNHSNLKIYVPRSSYNLYMQYSHCDTTVGAISPLNWHAYQDYIEPYDF